MSTYARTPLLLALSLALTSPCLAADPPGSLLREGMTLVYNADGKPSQRWKVEKVLHDQEWSAQKGATLIQYAAPGPGQAPEIRWRRLEGTMLHAYSEASGKWIPSRPVGPGMTWESKDSGFTTRYDTGVTGTDLIGGKEVPFVETTITSVDRDGKEIKRLREHYSLALETATRGTFETPDPDNAGQWKPGLVFELVEIVP